MKVTFIKGSNCYSHVRVSKFIRYFLVKGWDVSAKCWLRDKKLKDPSVNEEYIFFGGGFGSRILMFYYPLWMLSLFFRFIFYRQKKDEILFLVDFDCAFPIFMAKIFNKKLRYIYDIHDEFAIRYGFPTVIKIFIKKVDRLVRDSSFLTIHVDDIRVSASDKNYIVIYNSPEDYYDDEINNVESIEFKKNKIYCVSGLLNSGRGLGSLIKFAKNNSGVKFVVAGEAIDSEANVFLSLQNVDFLGYLSQEELFEKIKKCDAIFSLYDPSIEINRLAASNKLYDAMMLGVPVVVNEGLLMSEFVREINCGFVVEYNYSDVWADALDVSFSEYREKGRNGRKEYLEKYSYDFNFVKKLDLVVSRF